MLTILLIASAAAVALASTRFAADSRPGFDERPDGERFGVLR